MGLQVRCMATCRSWRQALDPKAFPFAASCVLGNHGQPDVTGTPLPADWIVSARPGVSLLRLWLSADEEATHPTLAALAALSAEVRAGKGRGSKQAVRLVEKAAM